MARLDIDRQKELEPKRMQYARNQITALGYYVTEIDARPYNLFSGVPRLHYTRIPVGLPGEPYPTIAINDVGNANRMIEFYVTGKQYDVYHVAFKGFTKG